MCETKAREYSPGWVRASFSPDGILPKLCSRIRFDPRRKACWSSFCCFPDTVGLACSGQLAQTVAMGPAGREHGKTEFFARSPLKTPRRFYGPKNPGLHLDNSRVVVCEHHQTHGALWTCGHTIPAPKHGYPESFACMLDLLPDLAEFKPNTQKSKFWVRLNQPYIKKFSYVVVIYYSTSEPLESFLVVLNTSWNPKDELFQRFRISVIIIIV